MKFHLSISSLPSLYLKLHHELSFLLSEREREIERKIEREKKDEKGERKEAGPMAWAISGLV